MISVKLLQFKLINYILITFSLKSFQCPSSLIYCGTLQLKADLFSSAIIVQYTFLHSILDLLYQTILCSFILSYYCGLLFWSVMATGGRPAYSQNSW